MPDPPPPNTELVTSRSGTRMIAPISGPSSVPAPPSAAMMIMSTEMRRPKVLSGSAKPIISA